MRPFQMEMKMLSREEKINKVVEMWHSKHTSGEIAIEVGITRNAVMGIVHRHGKRKTPLKVKAIKLKEIKEVIIPKKIEEKKPEPRLIVAKKYIKASQPFIEEMYKITKGKKLLELGPFDCRWIWDDKSYCAKPTSMCSYCEEHKKIVYTPPRKKTT